jgi:U3 small nucleolar RNA-associated protein 20
MKETNILHKRLAVQLCGIFVAAERENFQSRLEELLPELVKLLDVTHSELEDRDSDLLVIQTHYAIVKMTQHCPIGLQNVCYIDATDNLWSKVIHNLLHPHLWIRTLSARLIGTLLGWHKVEELVASALTQSEAAPKTYLMGKDTAAKLRSLASDSVAQLQSEQLDNQLVDQVIKNLVFLGKVASRLPSPPPKSQVEASEVKDNREKSLNLPWLTGKLRRELHAEVALNAKIPTKVVYLIFFHLKSLFFPNT